MGLVTFFQINLYQYKKIPIPINSQKNYCKRTAYSCMRVFKGVLQWVLLQQSFDHGSAYILKIEQSKSIYQKNHMHNQVVVRPIYRQNFGN